MIRRWRRSKFRIQETRKGSKSDGGGRGAEYPILEEKLRKIVLKKRDKGLRFPIRLVVANARKIFRSMNPQRKTIPPFGKHWAENFLERNDLSLRTVTRVAQKRPSDHETAIRDFHIRLRRFIGERGPFRLDQIVNCDQTPMPFSFL